MRMKVVDGIMGSGKTTWAIEFMDNTRKDVTNFMYVTPYLKETDRIQEKATKRTFKTPLDAKQQKGTKRLSKLEQLKKFIDNEEDVVITHELFKSFRKRRTFAVGFPVFYER
ncbi:hypothetical protein MK805_08550 [Shimazuella sp. AN120528]|uniref:hypothetical protein n=1 Tax=Shimazuella soli TaxID=1892854 RepID=UPI001F0D2ABC|nr:hypothetical protein [Shimazuella soli]MCH5585019.1 hypothetical protein [Shimazuella soli]